MTIDLTLLGKSIEAIRDEQRIQRAEVDALRSELQAQRGELQAQRGELQAQRAELKAMRIRLDLIDRSLADVVATTTATADAVTVLTASIDARFSETHRQMAANLEVVLQAIERRP
jgi:septal ring factor EnvC (AmiA/AmiB activator)